MASISEFNGMDLDLAGVEIGMLSRPESPVTLQVIADQAFRDMNRIHSPEESTRKAISRASHKSSYGADRRDRRSEYQKKNTQSVREIRKKELESVNQCLVLLHEGIMPSGSTRNKERVAEKMTELDRRIQALRIANAQLHEDPRAKETPSAAPAAESPLSVRAEVFSNQNRSGKSRKEKNRESAKRARDSQTEALKICYSFLNEPDLSSPRWKKWGEIALHIPKMLNELNALSKQNEELNSVCLVVDSFIE